MTRLAQTERHALCDTLEAAGPDAPTLCGDWRAADLAAHLLVREGRPDLAAGIVLPPLAPRTARAMEALQARTSFAEMVRRVRNGPPTWHPTHLRVVDEAANLVEMFIHHEDVLRADDRASHRHLSPELTKALGRRLRGMARLLLRGACVDVELVTPTGRTRVGRGDGPLVEVHGTPGELLVFAYGRQGVADVELVGPADAVESLRTAPLGV